MKLDDSIVQSYMNGANPETYKDCWIYRAFGRGNLFETPNPENCEWVSRLYVKLKNQIASYIPRNEQAVKKLFPDFDDIADNYTIMLVVGFPDPYDAMVMEHDGKEYMVFDLIQFGTDSLDEEYSCHKVLTHELIHMCLHRKHPKPAGLSYTDELNYIAFDEGFAHALTFPEDITAFHFNDDLNEKYLTVKRKLQEAYGETNPALQKESLISADTGGYWDKFASISGKLFLLKNKDKLEDIYLSGWPGFAEMIIKE